MLQLNYEKGLDSLPYTSIPQSNPNLIEIHFHSEIFIDI